MDAYLPVIMAVVLLAITVLAIGILPWRDTQLADVTAAGRSLVAMLRGLFRWR
jgi:hypothetical protein